MTKEHFWPDWLGPKIAKSSNGGGKYSHDVYSGIPKQTSTLESRMIRQGDVTTKKIRVVCGTCNNGWMSILENKLKPILLRMIEGESFFLTTKDQDLLAKWIVMKCMVSEHSEKNINVTPVDDRRKFFEKQNIPEYFSIWIGRSKDKINTGFMRQSYTMALSKNGPSPPLKGLTRNLQSISFFCGPLVVHVIAARVNGFTIDETFNFSPMTQIWPKTSEMVDWPLQHISQAELSRIFYSLQDFSEQKNVIYGGQI